MKASCVFLVAAVAGLLSGNVRAQTNSATFSYTLPPIEVKIDDLTPKFLAFYEAAQKEKASPDRRWELWKQMYHFAAAPPTPEGDKIARELLDKAWPRYAGALDVIRTGASALSPSPEATVRSAALLLQPEEPVKIGLLVFVGAFENNAFTTAEDGKVTTAIPIEMELSTRALIMTHELTHAVHINMGSFSGDWIRTVGTTVLTEGLAMRVTQKLFPNEPDSKFVEMTPGWLAQATARRKEILEGILPALTSKKSEDVMRFTMGRGPAGLEREAYYAGWLVVGHMLDHGMTFAQIARIPEREMPSRVAYVIREILKAEIGFDWLLGRVKRESRGALRSKKG